MEIDVRLTEWEATELGKDNKKNLISRMDIQVIIIVGIYTLLSTSFLSYFYFHYTFNATMKIMENRGMALHETVEEFIPPDSFYTVETPEDMEREEYLQAYSALTNMKNATGVLYLYTAKANEDGEFIYIIDGLEPEYDFRYPGDLIEEDIWGKMAMAMDDQIVMPSEILRTDWGDIFVAYFPYHDDNGEVLGVVGMEFEAGHIYETYESLRYFTVIFITILVFSGVVLSLKLFRRISNPLYLDKHVIDLPTGLKNRNSYEVDVDNMMARGRHIKAGVIVCDINGLKGVNDRLGHGMGDAYIKLVADSIRENCPKTMVPYRTGGDEFILIMEETDEEAMRDFIDKTTREIKGKKVHPEMRSSLACGYGIFNPESDYNLQDTCHKADVYMYREKRRQKEEQER